MELGKVEKAYIEKNLKITQTQNKKKDLFDATKKIIEEDLIESDTKSLANDFAGIELLKISKKFNEMELSKEEEAFITSQIKSQASEIKKSKMDDEHKVEQFFGYYAGLLDGIAKSRE